MKNLASNSFVRNSIYPVTLPPPFHCKLFLNLRPIIEEYQSSIQIEKFNEIDFQIIDYLLITLNSINRILKFFTSSKSLNFTYVLFAIMSIEKHLLSTLGSLQFQRLIAPFETFLSKIQEFKTILFSDDMNL